MNNHFPNPKLDLSFERIIDVPRALVWKAWTTPEHLMPWFCPKPWSVIECQIDLRPGGIFSTKFRSPEGVDHLNIGCYLEVIDQQRLIFTDALLPDFRPSGVRFMTGVIELSDYENGTKYTATALHNNEEDCKKHEEMGFYTGWGTALDQLITYVKALG